MSRIYAVTVGGITTDYTSYREAGRAYRAAQRAGRNVSAATWRMDDSDGAKIERLDTGFNTPEWAYNPKFAY